MSKPIPIYFGVKQCEKSESIEFIYSKLTRGEKMEKVNVEPSEKYYVGENFFIEIISNQSSRQYETWLFHKEIGIKLLVSIFSYDGSPSYENVLKIIELGLPFQIEQYKAEYMSA